MGENKLHSQKGWVQTMKLSKTVDPTFHHGDNNIGYRQSQNDKQTDVNTSQHVYMIETTYAVWPSA